MVNAFIQSCQPTIRRLLRNYEGYWHRYRLLITITCLTAIADFISTVHFMHHDGVHHELHPGIRLAAQELGPVVGVMLGKLAQLAALVLVTLYLRHIARLIFIAASLMYGWAAWYNLTGYKLYAPLLFEWLPL